MVSPVVSSALISAGGKILGGAFGKDDGPSFKEQLNNTKTQQVKLNYANIGSLVGAGKKYGIHPLTALGAGGVQASAPVYNNSSQNMSQNVIKAVTGAASEYFTGKANEEMNNLALERAKLENDLLRTQITSINNPAVAGSAYSNDSRVLNQTTTTRQSSEPIDKSKVDIIKDENLTRSTKDAGLTAGSEAPPPAGKKFTVGDTPHGRVYITLPSSGQADEYGEVYGALKGLEYLAKRGFVHYSNGTYKAGRKLRSMVTRNKRKYRKGVK